MPSKHVPPFRQGPDAQSLISASTSRAFQQRPGKCTRCTKATHELVTQPAPVKPTGQEQTNDSTPSVHTSPTLHGFGEQSLTSARPHGSKSSNKARRQQPDKAQARQRTNWCRTNRPCSPASTCTRSRSPKT